jgi:predicted oxidoreductase
MVVAVVLAVLLAASAYAQTTDFFELVSSGTPQTVQAAIDKGANVVELLHDLADSMVNVADEMYGRIDEVKIVHVRCEQDQSQPRL